MMVVMANRPSEKPDPDELKKLDLDPGAWPRFEKLVKAAAKGGPKPHAGPKTEREKKERPKRKSRD